MEKAQCKGDKQNKWQKHVSTKPTRMEMENGSAPRIREAFLLQPSAIFCLLPRDYRLQTFA